MNGGDGSDIYYVDNAGDVAAETYNDALGGVDTVYSSVTHTLGYGIENLTLTGSAAINGTGNANNNVINGNSGNNALYGLAGNDTMNGGLGNDTLDGGAGSDNMNGGDGSDIYYVDNFYDVVSESYNDALGGVDTVYSLTSHTLGYGIENLTLTGSAMSNAWGNGNNNVLKGNGNANILDGGAGADTMNGGDGNDTYYVDNFADVVSETYNDALGGADVVISSVTHTLGYGIENLTLTGSAAINGIGNTNNNVIYGNSGANYLFGSTGDDYLYGGAGNDTLSGGFGVDWVAGGTGNDDLYAGNDGSSVDKFVFNTALNSATNVDTIHTPDFPTDQIMLDNDIFSVLTSDFWGTNHTGTLYSGQFHSGLGVTGSGVFDSAGIYYDTSSGNLFYNPTLIGSDTILFAKIEGAPQSLSAADFTLF
jgi:Ca2+-binding RTX toxin-like protein